MNKTRKYSAEVRERAVRLVAEHAGEYDSEWAAITLISEKIGRPAETLSKWVRQAERSPVAEYETWQERGNRPMTIGGTTAATDAT